MTEPSDWFVLERHEDGRSSIIFLRQALVLAYDEESARRTLADSEPFAGLEERKPDSPLVRCRIAV